MKTYIAVFQGQTAREARPLLATSDREIVGRFVRFLRQRLPGPVGNTVNEDDAECDRGERR